jgi:hypothetical protein
MHKEFRSENLKGRDHSEDLGVDAMTDLREIGWECVEWMHLAQDMDLWRAVVNKVMNF